MIGIFRPDTLFKISAFVLTLAAYAIGGVPFKFLGWLLLICSFFLFRVHAISQDIRRILHLVIWLAAIFFVANILNLNESWNMPGRATASYPVFVSLRYLELMLFSLTLYISYRITQLKGTSYLLQFYTKLGFVIAVYALYVWVAQQYGWWEMPRTRIGTGGQDFLAQAVTFQYSFHRALGTFREPSHLAEWLIFPLFACLVQFDRRVYLPFVVMLGALLLTGSVLGVGMATTGTGILLVRRWKSIGQTRLRWLVIATGVALIAVYFPGFTLVDTVAERIGHFFEAGVFGTNRAHVWEYVYASPPPLFGFGLGNATIQLGTWSGSELSMSHLSAFLHYMYAGGVVALVFFVSLLVFPFLRVLKANKWKELWTIEVLLAVHGAWIFCYFFHTEVLDLSHATTLGLFFAAIREGKIKSL